MSAITGQGAKQAIADQVMSLTCHSSMGLIVNHIEEFLTRSNGVEGGENGIPTIHQKGKWNVSIQSFIGSAFLSCITYVSLRALAIVSLVYNGVIGLGKLALAFPMSLGNAESYKKAQDLCEEGFFHLVVGASDFAVQYFSLVLSIVSLGFGVSPDSIKEGLKKFYQPWGGAIHEGTDEAKEKKYCVAQVLADSLQRLIMPKREGDKNRFQQIAEAIDGTAYAAPGVTPGS